MLTRLLAGLFWLSVVHIVYVYVGFPLLALARARLRPRPIDATPIEPSVVVLIAAHNEEASIAAKVAGVLASDYPAERLRVLVASDGSSDLTVARVEALENSRVDVLDLPRGGKAATLNRAVDSLPSGTEVIVMSDANSLLDPAAIRMLVRPLADPEVGAVAGDQRYRAAAGAGGERSYWGLDRRLKIAESAAGSAIGATGALYAIRRDLYRPIPGHVNDDFYCSASVVGEGRRLVFEPHAIAYEPPAGTVGNEFGRKVRIITRALHTELALRRLADPRRTGFYALTFVSHKVLRHLVVVPLLLLAVVTPLLATHALIYRAALAGQAIVYGLGVAGIVSAGSRFGMIRALALPAFFLFANGAALTALWHVVRGRRIVHWTTDR